jgi:hypothetical protein
VGFGYGDGLLCNRSICSGVWLGVFVRSREDYADFVDNQEMWCDVLEALHTGVFQRVAESIYA